MKKFKVLMWATLAAIGSYVAAPVEVHAQVQAGGVSAYQVGPGSVGVVLTRRIQVKEPRRPSYWREEAAAGCIVRITNAQGVVLASVQCDTSGACSFTSLPIGRYHVKYYDVWNGRYVNGSTKIQITRRKPTSEIRKRISYPYIGTWGAR